MKGLIERSEDADGPSAEQSTTVFLPNLVAQQSKLCEQRRDQ